MFKRYVSVFALIGVLAVAAPAMAADAPAATPAAPAAAAAAPAHFPPAVVAVVDIERILKESTAGKSVRDQLSTRRTAYQAQVTADEQKLRDAEQALVQQRSTLPADQFEVKRREFEAQARAAQQRVQERGKDLDTAFGEALATIKQSVGQIVADIAESKGANVVLDKGQVIVVEAKLDLTAAVLEQLNRKLPRVAVRAAAPAAAPRAQAARQ